MQSRKAVAPRLNPTTEQTFEIEAVGPWNFARPLRESLRLQEEGRVEEACEERYHAVQHLLDLLPEEEPLPLAWEHANTQAALELLYLSMIDHFLIGDFELSAALGECLLDCDQEDHLGATQQLAFVYLAMEEIDSFRDLEADLSEKDPETLVLQLWAAWIEYKHLEKPLLEHFKSRHAAYYEEFCRTDHPADEAYRRDIGSEHPTMGARARELWLKTEHLWPHFSAFIEALQASR